MTPSLIRSIKIDLSLDIPNDIIIYFNTIFDALSIVEEDIYHKEGGEFVYYNNDKDWIFYQDDSNYVFWCNYEKYWLIFENKYGINYVDMGLLTKFLVENVLKCSITGRPGAIDGHLCI